MSEGISRFAQVLSQYHRHLVDAQTHARTLGVDTDLTPLVQDALRSEFRVSVLGRFKSGKSSVVNTLVGEALVQTDVLPCTSTLIEIRQGRRAFEQCQGDERRVVSCAEFKQESSGAATKSSAAKTSWSITLPTDVLVPGLVLVDTPGLDEDDSREEIVIAELKRTDAAVFVVRADQPGGMSELGDIEALQARVPLVLVLVNRADTIEASDRARLLEFARERLSDVGVPAERVLLFSAADPSLVGLDGRSLLDAAREVISTVLLQNTAGARLAALHGSVLALLDRVGPKMDKVVAKRDADAKDAERELATAQQALAAIEFKMQFVHNAWRDAGKRCSEQTMKTAISAWSEILASAMSTQARWTSDRDPVLQPTAYAEAIGEKARDAILREVRKFVVREVQPEIQREIGKTQRTIRAHVREISCVVHGRFDEVGFEDRLLRDVLADAFGDALGRASNNAAEIAVAATISTIVGYIVADVVLFYILGVISGFLAPPLMVAAAVAGVLTYALMGRDWVRGWIRDKIASNLEEKLAEPDVQTQVGKAVRTATREIFKKLMAGYDRQLRTMVTDASDEQAARKKALKVAAQMHCTAAVAAREARKRLREVQRVLAREQAVLARVASPDDDA